MGIYDHTRTAMGARCLRRWFKQPLRDRARLKARQEVVTAWLADDNLDGIRNIFPGCSDLERILSRVATGNAKPEIWPAYAILCVYCLGLLNYVFRLGIYWTDNDRYYVRMSSNCWSVPSPKNRRLC